MHMRVHFREINLGTRQLQAERRRALLLRRRLRGGEQRLRGDAAVIEAVAAHLAFFDQHHRHAERSGSRRDRKAAGAGPDDADVGSENLHSLPFPRRSIRRARQGASSRLAREAGSGGVLSAEAAATRTQRSASSSRSLSGCTRPLPEWGW